jgi:hypothetical protein
MNRPFPPATEGELDVQIDDDTDAAAMHDFVRAFTLAIREVDARPGRRHKEIARAVCARAGTEIPDWAHRDSSTSTNR